MPNSNQYNPKSSTYALRSMLAGIPKAEAGVREEGGPNTGKRVREYQDATDHGGTGFAWCAAFVCWAVLQWGKYPEFLKAIGKTPDQFKAWRPKWAGAYRMEEWADLRGVLVMRDVRTPKPGLLHTLDIITFRSISHIGIVLTDDDKGNVSTVEGNTNASGHPNGDGVYLRTRKQSDVRAVIRIVP